MEIKVLGPGCAKCKKAETVIRQVVESTGADATVEKITDMMEIAGYGVVSTPAVVVNGDIKCAGKVPKEEEVKSWLNL